MSKCSVARSVRQSSKGRFSSDVMRQSAVWRIAVFGALLLVLAGCSSDDGGSSPPPEETPTPPAAETPTLPVADTPVPTPSLLGEDNNGDGVRDDVEAAIAARHPDDATARAALSQVAACVQEMIGAAAGEIDVEVSAAAGRLVEAVDCLHASTEDPPRELLEVENLMTDTRERGDMYDIANSMVSGQFFGGDDDLAAGCNAEIFARMGAQLP